MQFPNQQKHITNEKYNKAIHPKEASAAIQSYKISTGQNRYNILLFRGWEDHSTSDEQ